MIRNFLKIRSDIKIPLIYIILGALWIIYSGKLLHSMVKDPATEFEIEIYKGWFYVLLTGFLLFILIHNDTRQRNKVLKELEQAKKKAEESDKLKSAFLANLSHYLRTPMNSILGFIDLLKNRNLDETKREKFMAVINEQSNYLLQFIGNIIEISKLQEGQLQVNIKAFSVHKLLEKIKTRYQTEIEIFNKKNQVEIGIVEEDSEMIMHNDPEKIEYIFSNLLSNALKFTKTGNITFGYRIQAGEAEFFVEDTGSGIPPEKQAQVIRTFMLSNPEVNEENIGIGLGLALSNGLIKLLKGKLWLAQSTSQGTRFCFTTPVNLLAEYN